jgi:hypothetical protein
LARQGDEQLLDHRFLPDDCDADALLEFEDLVAIRHVTCLFLPSVVLVFVLKTLSGSRTRNDV